MSNIVTRLLGGRPMRLIRFEFTDVVDGKPVYLWEDRFGRQWLANGKWSLFRVEVAQLPIFQWDVR